MAPKYVLQGHFSIKWDIFSFGVLLLEIVSGQTLSKFSGGENGECLLSFVSIKVSFIFRKCTMPFLQGKWYLSLQIAYEAMS